MAQDQPENLQRFPFTDSSVEATVFPEVQPHLEAMRASVEQELGAGSPEHQGVVDLRAGLRIARRNHQLIADTIHQLPPHEGSPFNPELVASDVAQARRFLSHVVLTHGQDRVEYPDIHYIVGVKGLPRVTQLLLCPADSFRQKPLGDPVALQLEVLPTKEYRRARARIESLEHAPLDGIEHEAIFDYQTDNFVMSAVNWPGVKIVKPKRNHRLERANERLFLGKKAETPHGYRSAELFDHARDTGLILHRQAKHAKPAKVNQAHGVSDEDMQAFEVYGHLSRLAVAFKQERRYQLLLHNAAGILRQDPEWHLRYSGPDYDIHDYQPRF